MYIKDQLILYYILYCILRFLNVKLSFTVSGSRKGQLFPRGREGKARAEGDLSTGSALNDYGAPTQYLNMVERAGWW